MSMATSQMRCASLVTPWRRLTAPWKPPPTTLRSCKNAGYPRPRLARRIRSDEKHASFEQDVHIAEVSPVLQHQTADVDRSLSDLGHALSFLAKWRWRLDVRTFSRSMASAIPPVRDHGERPDCHKADGLLHRFALRRAARGFASNTSTAPRSRRTARSVLASTRPNRDWRSGPETTSAARTGCGMVVCDLVVSLLVSMRAPTGSE